MTRTGTNPDFTEEIAALIRELRRDKPVLATRLESAFERLTNRPPTTSPTGESAVAEPPGYVSTGEAAAALGVSPNTVKKWVRLGYVRDFWVLPGSGYVKIARTEIDRIQHQSSVRRDVPGPTAVPRSDGEE